ncbi:hypothetical protein bcere0009_22170 [Bacillus cereus R309803]|nr:hypothetical protein bcere0009_22170 [Bacillus cereus R309803]
MSGRKRKEEVNTSRGHFIYNLQEDMYEQLKEKNTILSIS